MAEPLSRRTWRLLYVKAVDAVFDDPAFAGMNGDFLNTLKQSVWARSRKSGETSRAAYKQPWRGA